MHENDRPLPTPPRARFGRDLQEDADPAATLTSDRMALAAAEGRLEEFLQHEIPPSDHARDLAMMMMGMSGMIPAETAGGPPRAVLAQSPTQPGSGEPTGVSPEVPPEVLSAIQQGDVANLTGILRAEHAKRAGLGAMAGSAPASPAAPTADRPAVPSPVLPTASAVAAAGGNRAGIDAAIIDELIRISTDNDVTVDWLMLRAVKLYVEEHRKTGRL